jgi:hypothetical protein
MAWIPPLSTLLPGASSAQEDNNFGLTHNYGHCYEIFTVRSLLDLSG